MTLVPFLDENPPRRRKARRRKGSKRRRPPRGFRSWKAYMASIRPGAKKKRRRHRKGATVAKRRKKGRRRHRNPVGRRSHRRRSHRSRSRGTSRRRHRNPPRGLGRGVVGHIIGGAVDAAEILVGKAAVNTIAGFLPVTQTGAVGALAKIVAAVAVSWAARKVSPNASKMTLAGGLLAVIEPPVKAANIPLLSAGLSDYPSNFYVPGPLAVGSYPKALSSYPTFSGTDDFGADADMAEMGQG